MQVNAAIGIIGGADGPTAIYVSSNWPSSAVKGIAAVVLVVAVAIFVYLFRKHRKQNR